MLRSTGKKRSGQDLAPTGTTPKGKVTGDAISQASVVIAGVPLKTWTEIKEKFDDDSFTANAELSVSKHGFKSIVPFLFKTFMGKWR